MPKQTTINVTRAHLPDRQKFDRYVDKIFASGWMTNNGDCVQELEKKLESYLGVKNLVLVGNGTLALLIAYKLLELSGEVVTTPFSFIATASSIQWHGAVPVFADIDTSTFNLEPASLHGLVTERTSAIVPVHVYGNPCQLEAIDTFATANGLKTCYDASHAFGVRNATGSVLSNGDISTLSFHATKLFHTIEGGALIIKDDELCVQARRMINFGFENGEISSLGINAKMNEFEAAVGLCVLEDINDILDSRKAIHDLYSDALADFVEFPCWQPGYDRNYGYFPVVFSTESQLLKAMKLLADRNVMARRYFYPSLDTLDFLNPRSSSRSQDCAGRVACLPIYEGLLAEQCVEIAEVIKKACLN